MIGGFRRIGGMKITFLDWLHILNPFGSVREHIALLRTQLAIAERRIAELVAENQVLKSEVERVRKEHDTDHTEYEKLKRRLRGDEFGGLVG
jgi:regulator of replication initiation timing